MTATVQLYRIMPYPAFMRGQASTSAPKFRGVEPKRSAARFSDFLHHMLRAARPVAAFAVPEANEFDLVRAEARGRLEHPEIVTVVRLCARRRRPPLTSPQV